MPQCPNCGTVVPDGQKFCGECGTPIPQKKKCPQCGTEWPNAQKFCGECGFNFATVNAAPQKPAAPSAAESDDDKEYEEIGEEEAREGIFTDHRDGQTYNVIKIGKQIWFAENYRGECDGVHVYDCDMDNLDNYGALYNWDSAMSEVPEGWRLPSKKDFKELCDYVSKITGEDNTRALMSNTDDWDEEFGSGTDVVGFNARPAGFYNPDYSEYEDLGISTNFWTSNEDSSEDAFVFNVAGSSFDYCLEETFFKTRGFSVRYVKDFDKVEFGEIFWTKIKALGASEEEKSSDDEVGMTPLSEEDQEEMEAAKEAFYEGDFKGALQKMSPVFQNNTNNFEVYKWCMRILDQYDKDAAYEVATDGEIAENICDASFIRIERALANDDVDEAIEILDEAKEKWPENPLVFTADVMIGCHIDEHGGDNTRFEEAINTIYDNMQVGLEGDDFEKESCFQYAEWLIAKGKGKKLPTLKMDCWHYMAFPKSKAIEVVEEEEE